MSRPRSPQVQAGDIGGLSGAIREKSMRHCGGVAAWICCWLAQSVERKEKSSVPLWVSIPASGEMIVPHTEMRKTGGETGCTGKADLRALFWTC